MRNRSLPRLVYRVPLLTLAVLAMLAGCATTPVNRVPGQVETAAIRAGQKTIVLFRTTTTESRDMEAYEHLDSVQWDMWRLDTWEKPESVSLDLNTFWRTASVWRVPSKLRGREGWRYLVLKPGTYFVRVVPEEASHESLDYERMQREAYLAKFPAYHISIPDSQTVVYAGSFHFERHEQVRRDWIGLKTKNVSFEPCTVQEETDLARQVGKEAFNAIGDVMSAVAVPYHDLRAAVSKLSDRGIVRVEAEDGLAFVMEDVGKKAAATAAAPLAVPGAFLIETADYREDFENDDDLDAELAATAAGMVLMVAAVPFGVAADKTFGEAARKAWAPHENALRGLVSNYHLHEQLAESLRKRLSTRQTNRLTNEPSLVVQLRPYRLFLRRTHKNQFALETAIHVRLLDADSRTVIWQNGFVCSDWGRVKHRFSCAPYETPTKYASSSHALEEYKWEAGLLLLRTEMDKAVNAFAEEIAQRLKEGGLYFTTTN